MKKKEKENQGGSQGPLYTFSSPESYTWSLSGQCRLWRYTTASYPADADDEKNAYCPLRPPPIDSGISFNFFFFLFLNKAQPSAGVKFLFVGGMLFHFYADFHWQYHFASL